MKAQTSHYVVKNKRSPRKTVLCFSRRNYRHFVDDCSTNISMFKIVAVVTVVNQAAVNAESEVKSDVTVARVGNVVKTDTLPNLPIEQRIKDKFGKDGEIALAVAKSESKLNPNAHNVNSNGTTDTGIFQINSCHGYSEEYLRNDENNIQVAYELYQKSGESFGPWVAYTNQSYLKNL